MILSVTNKTFSILLCISCVVFGNTLWRLVNSYSVSELEAITKLPVKHVGDDTKITIFSGPEREEGPFLDGFIPDFSPFVNRVECYLKLIGQHYDVATTKDLSENPRHKYPFANVMGTMVDDSSQIIKEIQTKLHVKPPDLSEQQRRDGYFVQSLLTDSYYFCMLRQVFLSASGRAFVSDMMENKIPWILRPLIMFIVFRDEYANLYGQGIGRYPMEVAVSKAEDHIGALASLLGKDRQFILGTADPTIFDTDVYAFLCYVYQDKWPEYKAFFEHLKERHPALLVDYMDRMNKILFRKSDESEVAAE